MTWGTVKPNQLECAKWTHPCEISRHHPLAKSPKHILSGSLEGFVHLVPQAQPARQVRHIETRSAPRSQRGPSEVPGMGSLVTGAGAKTSIGSLLVSSPVPEGARNEKSWQSGEVFSGQIVNQKGFEDWNDWMDNDGIPGW